MTTLFTKPKPSTLHTLTVDPLAPYNRVYSLLYSLGILALLYHHCTTFLASPSFLPLPLLLADLVLAFMWGLGQPFRWRSVRRREFPDSLIDMVARKNLPALDVFICTADPHKEPPMSVVSTALSVMAFDYPTDRLSVYVSDDGGSEVTLFAFVEAAMFARYWLPFCRENGLKERSPEVYFSSSIGGNSDKMKLMYRAMKEKVEGALQRGYVTGNDLIATPKETEIFKKWKGFTCHDHPSIIQVLLESSKDTDITGNALPNLIYVSREKNINSPHHFKAGALNTLIRVSSVMTNAPVVLTLDCDMYSNDPQSPLRALCYLLDPAMASNLAYVQFPQHFQGLNKNDIYGGELKRQFRINSRGLDGFSGPDNMGSNCFFNRQALRGSHSSPLAPLGSHDESEPRACGSLRLDSVLKRAHEVASCNYEVGTKWGSTIGFRYGSLVEDFHTGYRLHCEGWKSIFCDPERPAFVGEAPKNLDDALGQIKRWCIGNLEVAISKHNPLTFGIRNASLPVGLCYAHYAYWGLWCIPLTIYAFLPPLALIYRKRLFPEVSDPWFYLYAYLFLAAYLTDLMDFLRSKGTIHRWWNDQRIWMARGLTSCLFGTIQFALNHVGISTPRFNVTSKVMEEEQSERYDKGMLDFGVASPFFMILGTSAVVNLSSFVMGIARAMRIEEVFNEMLVQLFLSGFVAANCLPIYEAMFLRKDGGKMPGNITLISILAAGFLHLIGCFMFII
ncbi:cellulose synthase-like protein G3 [Elaeis guineensis]|uniref:Cellulose synthase-like protein G3 n=1 Tax=Elaeis guineensis var. tenera TaxID=51953 RepID=A0A6I9QQ44_ELAGV|nr:cellulose synthase-like protein G3 [Elaeis guineensis]